MRIARVDRRQLILVYVVMEGALIATKKPLDRPLYGMNLVHLPPDFCPPNTRPRVPHKLSDYRICPVPDRNPKLNPNNPNRNHNNPNLSLNSNLLTLNGK